MCSNHEPIAVRVVDSPFPGAGYAVQLGTRVGLIFWPLDIDMYEAVMHDTFQVFGMSGAWGNKWASTDQSVFAFVNHSDMLLFAIKWRGHPERW